MQPHFIITGSCRSGQRRLVKALNLAGLRTSYERDSNSARVTVSWMLGADCDSYLGQHEPYWNREVLEIWHNVRHPLGAIPSIARNMSSRLIVWQYHQTNLHPANPVYPNRRMWAAQFWAKWNRLVEERRPAWQFRIEEFEQIWPEILERLGEPYQDLDPNHEHYRHRGFEEDRDSKIEIEPMTYDEIKAWSPSVCDEVRRLAEKYGYEE